MKRRYGLGLVVLGAGAVLSFNGSWRADPPPDARIRLLAHRGVHQTFDRTGLENDTCTAARIFPPTHGLLENTLPSMRAAFDAGATVVELDVHPTTDGRFAVFHDWTVDCRTEGTGETRSHDLASLKELDVGYGYTADGGRTWPFRGAGVGLMPELGEVLSTFPDGRFLVNFKSNEAREGDLLADLLLAHPEWRDAVWGAYGGDPPTARAAERIDGLVTWSRRGLSRCLLGYAAIGWTGRVPEACRDTEVMVPLDVAPFLWGWPHLFVRRLRAVGSEVILLGPYTSGDPGAAGIDTLEQLDRVPGGFDGWLWTNRVEVIGPALRERQPTLR